jgi:hypothetical protein
MPAIAYLECSRRHAQLRANMSQTICMQCNAVRTTPASMSSITSASALEPGRLLPPSMDAALTDGVCKPSPRG